MRCKSLLQLCHVLYAYQYIHTRVFVRVCTDDTCTRCNWRVRLCSKLVLHVCKCIYTYVHICDLHEVCSCHVCFSAHQEQQAHPYKQACTVYTYIHIYIYIYLCMGHQHARYTKDLHKQAYTLCMYVCIHVYMYTCIFAWGVTARALPQHARYTKDNNGIDMSKYSCTSSLWPQDGFVVVVRTVCLQ